MAKIKKKLKKFGRYVWELFKGSFPATIMYVMAGSILLMLTMKPNETTKIIPWDNKALMWTIVCIVAAAAYNALVSWAMGGSHYEMLVSGNIKRVSASYGEGYKISSHKEAKEYREWKGFAMGVWSALFTLVGGIFFGCNQGAIDGAAIGGDTMSTGLAIFTLVFLFITGWSLLPFYYMNMNGIAVNYFLTCLFALIPIAVTGAFYIAGAYARRNKAIRQQEMADRAAAAEAAKVKKINYGGLPGTKPKKRK